MPPNVRACLSLESSCSLQIATKPTERPEDGDGNNPWEKFSRNLHVLLILVAISLDPLFFYIPVVNDDSNCLGLDNTLRIIVVFFRSLADVGYIILWFYHKSAYREKKTYKKILSVVAAILAMLPLPQVIVYVVSWRLLTVQMLKSAVLIQFVPRVYLTIPTYKYAREISHGSINMWFAAAFYFFLFLLFSNVLGAFWYLRAIERNMDCWRKACRTRSLCGVSSFYCNKSSSNNKYLDEFCPIPPSPNSTFFDYGIYVNAFQREIMSIHTNFPNKFIHCLWWGLQSLSSFGQNLEPGTYIWDNFFAVLVIISGLVLVAALIGNMQEYLRKEAPDIDKEERLEWLKKEMNDWGPFNKFPQKLKDELSTCEDQKWLDTAEINVETVLKNCHGNRKRNLEDELRKEMFPNGDNFKGIGISDAMKVELRKRAKPKVFQERSIIYKEGYPISQMIHIVDGKVLAFNRVSNSKEKKEQSETHRCKLINDNNIGNELLDIAHKSSEPNLPFATETFQALTKVEAFTLSFDDLASVFRDKRYFNHGCCSETC